MDETMTTSTETITNEDIDRAFADAFGTDDILFGDDDGDGTVTDTKVTAETDNGSKDTDNGDGADETSVSTDTEKSTETDTKSDETATDTKPDEDTHEVEELRAKLEKANEELAKAKRREKDIAEHLKGDGYDSIDAELADRLGISVEEYEKRLGEETDAELAEKYRKLKAEQEAAKKRSATEELFRKDERELIEYDPQLKGRFTKLEQAPFFKDFALLRSIGKSAIDAYRMANYKELSEREAKTRSAQTPSTDNRGHITSSATRQIGAEVTSIPADEIAMARELFPDLSDAEIDKLYKKIK